jgi:hypothetical protein
MWADSRGQAYPAWFLDQQVALSGPTAVGYAHASFYPDSSAAQAIRDGCARWVRQQQTTVEGGQLFWSTALGTAWMGSSIQECYDTAAVAAAIATLAPLDTLFSDNLTAVLLGPLGSVLDPVWRERRSVTATRAPDWTEQPPHEIGFAYAIGVAPAYYYEMSSWDEAERNARLNLARTISVKVGALQQMAVQDQALQREQVSVVLRNAQTVARWVDPREGIYYVLVQKPR